MPRSDGASVPGQFNSPPGEKPSPRRDAKHRPGTGCVPHCARKGCRGSRGGGPGHTDWLTLQGQYGHARPLDGDAAHQQRSARRGQRPDVGCADMCRGAHEAFRCPPQRRRRVRSEGRWGRIASGGGLARSPGLAEAGCLVGFY